MYLTNLELAHLGVMDSIDSGVLDAACSLIPGSLCDIDRTMGKTFHEVCKRIRYCRFSYFGNDLFPLMSCKFMYLYKTLMIHSAFIQ